MPKRIDKHDDDGADEVSGIGVNNISDNATARSNKLPAMPK
jgi:hypothetical protein